MKKNKTKFTSKLTNAIEPAIRTSVWGYRGCAGKGGATRNSTIVTKTNVKETE